MTDGVEPIRSDEPASQTSQRSFWAGRSPRSLAYAAGALLAGGVAMITLHGGKTDTPRYTAVVDDAPQPSATIDPLMTELVRCRSLPPQSSDAACERAWDENRRRFFGETGPMRVSSDPLPTYAQIPEAR